MTGAALTAGSGDPAVPGRGTAAVLGRWWLQVGVVWLASRAVTTAIMLAVAAHEHPTFWAPADPSYLRFAQFWDSGWFHTIATSGYPTRLPIGPDGRVLPNAWAFLPGYPAVVQTVAGLTRLPWDVASVAVSVACSLGAALVLDRLLLAVLGRRSTFALALFCFGPLSPLFQVAYAESMTALLLAGVLLLLVRRRYGLLAPVVLLAGLTRPIGVPIALLLAGHLVVRLVRERGLPRSSALGAAGALGVALAAAVAWPCAAAAATGDGSAYVRSELAWRGGTSLEPFAAWPAAAASLAGPVLGPVLLGAGVLAFAALLLIPPVRRLGADIRIWCAAYGVYLLAVFAPQSSTVRLLLPLFPLVGAAAAVRSRWVQAALLLAAVLGQAVWFAATWAGWPVRGWSPP